MTITFTSSYRNLRLYYWRGGKIVAAQFRNGRFRTRSLRTAAAVAWQAGAQRQAKVFIRGDGW